MAKRILLADDSITIQKVVRITLADTNYELSTVVDNGDDALTAAKQDPPDLIMADVVMPGLDGYQVCEAVKGDPALAHIPVLLLAGSFEAFDEMRSAKIGADGHSTKPVGSQALSSKLTDPQERQGRARPEPAQAA